MKKYFQIGIMMMTLVVSSVSFAQDGTKQPAQKKTEPVKPRSGAAVKKGTPIRVMKKAPAKPSTIVKE
jgi:hypothetical protein